MSSKHNIKCHSWTDDRKEFFVTSDSRVWPCSIYSAADQDPLGNKHKINDDKYIAELNKSTPGWNNCEVNTLESILDHDFFNKHISKESWASDNPPAMCLACCNYKGKQ
jgi:hypothetical protein